MFKLKTIICKSFKTYGFVFFALLFLISNNANSQTDTVLASDSTIIPAPIADTTKITDLSKALADTTTKNKVSSNEVKKMLDATFLKNDIILSKGEIISNVLKIVNNDKKNFNFSLEISHPYNWKSLSNNEKIYTLKPSDTIYVPIRVVPNTEIKGNTKFLINAFLIDEKTGKQSATAFFFCATKKQVKWELTVNPNEKVYFKNDEYSSQINVNVFNSGNEEQDILFTMSEIGRNVMITDTTGKIVKKRFFDLSLEPTKDTNLFYEIKYSDEKRNFKRIDNEGYIPKSNEEEKKFTLFLKTTESKQATKSTYSNGKKLTFIKLSNSKKVNPYSSSVIPLIMDANVFNILGNQPVMNLVLRGNTFLNNGDNIVYFSQLNYNTYSYNKNFLRNGFLFLGYYSKKYDVQVGNINGGNIIGGAPVVGKGISGHYKINEKHKVGAFFSKAPAFFQTLDKTSFGVNHKFNIRKGIVLNSSYTRVISTRQKNNIDFFGTNLSYSINKSHQVSYGMLVSRNESTIIIGPSGIKNGFQANASYSGRYFKNKLGTNLRGLYSSKNFSNAVGDRSQILHRSTYSLSKKWTPMLQNIYNTNEITYIENSVLKQGRNTNFINQLMLSRYENFTRISPNIFYNIFENFGTRIHYRGVGLDYNYYNNITNLRVTSSLKGGYNNLIDFPKIKEYFSLQFFGIAQYRNFSINARYNYGPTSVRNIQYTLNSQAYPQLLYTSIQYQYLFKDIRFLLMANVNYSYSNLLNSNSFGINPDLYFFSYNGWRLRLGMGYNATRSNNTNAISYLVPLPQNTNEDQPNFNHNFNLTIGARKEFGIPVPKKWSKLHFYNVTFHTFMDINGNMKKDNNEVVLGNVVIRLGEDEVLTNDLGRAELINVKQEYKKFTVFSLVDLKGWFPLISDSISIDATTKDFYIPYVKGVKVYGNIIVDREKYADSDIPLDMSRIRITATDSLGKAYGTLTDEKGTFCLYVPYGKYTLNMDEFILGDRFQLAQNNVEMELRNGLDNIYNTFYVIEKRRKVNKKVFKNGTSQPNNNQETGGAGTENNNGGN